MGQSCAWCRCECTSADLYTHASLSMMIAPPVNKLQEMAESETPPRVKPEHNKRRFSSTRNYYSHNRAPDWANNELTDSHAVKHTNKNNGRLGQPSNNYPSVEPFSTGPTQNTQTDRASARSVPLMRLCRWSAHVSESMSAQDNLVLVDVKVLASA